MKLIINKSQYSLLVEETVPNISDTREEIKKYCSPVKVSANIINSNMDKFININQFNIFFDEKANEYLSKWNKKDAGKVNKLLNMSELLNETKKTIGPSIVNMCRKYILVTFGYKPSINIGQEMEKIIQVIFDNLYKKFTDNLVINTAVRIAVTKENVDKVKIGADNFMNSIVYNLDLVKDKMIFDAYLPIVDEHDNTASQCKKAIVTKDKNGKQLSKEKRYYPRYPHYENTTLDYQYKSGPILKPLIGKVFDLLNSYS